MVGINCVLSGQGLISKEVNVIAYWRKVEHGGIRRRFRSGLTPTVLFKLYPTVTDIDGTLVRLTLNYTWGSFYQISRKISAARSAREITTHQHRKVCPSRIEAAPHVGEGAGLGGLQVPVASAMEHTGVTLPSRSPPVHLFPQGYLVCSYEATKRFSCPRLQSHAPRLVNRDSPTIHRTARPNSIWV